MVCGSRGDIAVFYRVVGAGLSKVIFERRPDVGERLNPQVSWGRALQAERTANAKVLGTKCSRALVVRKNQESVQEGQRSEPLSHWKAFGFYSE